jgi:hypothetical protein
VVSRRLNLAQGVDSDAIHRLSSLSLSMFSLVGFGGCGSGLVYQSPLRFSSFPRLLHSAERLYAREVIDQNSSKASLLNLEPSWSFHVCRGFQPMSKFVDYKSLRSQKSSPEH